jgi:hypothetical protein
MAITVLRRNARAHGLYVRLGFRVVGETETHILMEWRAGTNLVQGPP